MIFVEGETEPVPQNPTQQTPRPINSSVAAIKVLLISASPEVDIPPAF